MLYFVAIHKNLSIEHHKTSNKQCTTHISETTIITLNPKVSFIIKNNPQNREMKFSENNEVVIFENHHNYHKLHTLSNFTTHITILYSR
jgi:hypothetical protein